MHKNNFELPFDSTKDVFRWGPVPGAFFYVSVFTEVHFKHFREKYNENWSETFFLFKDKRMFWVNNAPDVVLAGEKVSLRYMSPENTRQKIYAEWKQSVEKLRIIEKKIDSTGVASLSDLELLKLWNEFHESYIAFWTTGSVPELANYGSVEYLEKKLADLISDTNERAEALQILTAPTQVSFYQEEEIALSQANDLSAHQQNYFWLKNSYAGTEMLPISFFAERKSKLSSALEKNIEQKFREDEKNKKQVQKQYGLTKEIMDVAEAICAGIGWQDERKKYLLIILRYLDAMAGEAARRFGYTRNDFDNLWYFEIAEIMEGKNFRAEIEKRKTGFGVQFFHDCKELTADEVVHVWQAYDSHEKDQETDMIKGTVACKGNGEKIIGRIHILLDPSKTEDFKEGEILVAPMTSPEYIFAMRKASAVLTDTGGLTSHAAIVSRELGIPCIVGTKSATKIFKNGDKVEIDPALGVAKKI